MIDGVLQDLRYGARALMREPLLTAIVVLSLALGIGANATVFSWIDAVLLRPFPGVPEPERLVAVSSRDTREGAISMSHADYLDLRVARGLAGLAAQDEIPLALRVGEEAPERIWGLVVSENYFDVMGVRPALGRVFLPHETTPGGHPVAVIADALWRRRFGTDPAVVGREVTLNARPFTIVGVMPPEFRGSVVGLQFDMWVPLAMQQPLQGVDRLSRRGNRWLQGVARLASGVTPAEARAELNVIAARLAAAYPEDRDVSALVQTFSEGPTGAGRAMRPVLATLAVVVAFVMAIACANVANVLLARAIRRRREIAVRLSLGASRARIVRQMLTESLLLAGLAAAAGLLVAVWGSGLLLAFVPPTDLPVGLVPRVDGRVLAVTAVVSFLAALLFGLAPALQAASAETAGALREESLGAGGGRTRARLRSSLVAGQFALSLMLLVAAGLLVRSLRNAQSVDVGFDPRGVLLASVDLQGSGYAPEQGRAFHREVLARLRGLPGVTSATLTRRAPLGLGGKSSSTMTVEGYEPPPDKPAWFFTHTVGPDYFRTMRWPLERGRDFTDADDAGAPAAVIVDEVAARTYWAGRDPLGGRVRLGPDRWATVVGVAREGRYQGLNEKPSPHVFFPVLQAYHPQTTLVARAASDPEALAPQVASAVRALDPAMPVFNVVTLAQHVSAATYPQRLASSLLAGLGLLALVLSTVGLHGVLAWAVGQRTREIGIRMALGGRRSHVFRLVVGQGLRLALAGTALGLVAAAGAARALSALLIKVSPLDPATFAAVAALLVAVAALACALPAHRATRIDPAAALRHE